MEVDIGVLQTQAREYQLLPAANWGYAQILPLEPLEWARPHQNLDHDPVKLILDCWSPDLGVDKILLY